MTPSDNSQEKIYKLITTDNTLFELNSEDMSQSLVFTEVATLADTRTDLTANQPIPVPRVTSDVMHLIQKWCQAMRINEPNTSTWRGDFLATLSEAELNKFVAICDHLGIKSVLDETKADMIRRMTELKPGETLCFSGRTPRANMEREAREELQIRTKVVKSVLKVRKFK